MNRKIHGWVDRLTERWIASGIDGWTRSQINGKIAFENPSFMQPGPELDCSWTGL